MKKLSIGAIVASFFVTAPLMGAIATAAPFKATPAQMKHYAEMAEYPCTFGHADIRAGLQRIWHTNRIPVITTSVWKTTEYEPSADVNFACFVQFHWKGEAYKQHLGTYIDLSADQGLQWVPGG